jgi:transposase
LTWAAVGNSYSATAGYGTPEADTTTAQYLAAAAPDAPSAVTESVGQAANLGTAALAATRRVFDRWHQYRAGALSHADLAAYLEPVTERLQTILTEAAANRHWRVEGPGRHLLKHFESLWTFAQVAGVEPTNNHAGRALRRGVLWRKRSFGHKSENGRAFVERMLTVVDSLRLQGRNVLACLEEACRASVTGGSPPSLLPHPSG